MYIKLQLFCLFLAVPCFINLGFCDPIFSSNEISQPVISNSGMVASDNDLATEAGIQILKEGGNAIDVAVTVGFTMAVTSPRAGNIGGGGFMLIYLADTKKVVSIDYREKAPKAATRKMFLDEYGNIDSEKSRHSYLAVGVPGTVAGLSLALQKYGTISIDKARKFAGALMVFVPFIYHRDYRG